MDEGVGAAVYSERKYGAVYNGIRSTTRTVTGYGSRVAGVRAATCSIFLATPAESNGRDNFAK